MGAIETRLELVECEGDISEVTLKLLKDISGFKPSSPQIIIPIHPLTTKAPIPNTGVCLYRMGASENLIMSISGDYSKALECKACIGGYSDSSCYTPFSPPPTNSYGQYPSDSPW